MVTLDQLLDSGDDAQDRAGDTGRRLAAAVRAGLWWIGWAAAKLVLIVLLGLAGVLFGAGWLAGRVLWPGLCWAGRAVKLGYQEGRGRSHGPA